MKYLDRFINFIFSVFVLVLSAFVTLMAANILEYQALSSKVGDVLFSNENRTITCIVSIIVFVMALKTTVFLSTPNRKRQNVVYVDTNNGKVQIAQDTIENTAKSAVKQYDCVKDAKAKMIKAKKGIDIYMQLYVLNDTNIMDLTSKAQDDVKFAVEGSTGVRVNNVDIQIKNTSDIMSKLKLKEEKKAPEPEKENKLDVPIFNTDKLPPEPEKVEAGELIEVRPLTEEEKARAQEIGEAMQAEENPTQETSSVEESNQG